MNTIYRYTVYRNADDKLMILDGTAFECAEIMNMERQSFYRICNRGGNAVWSILKTSMKQIEIDQSE